MDFLTEKSFRACPDRAACPHKNTRYRVFHYCGLEFVRIGPSYSKAGEVTLTLKLPLFPIFYVVAFCCFIECLMLVVELTPSKQGSEQ